MTWQRIDDNTYIDDTLVTCAEYQLFIEEMREQGKYYQPDHWTSYEFSEGQARGPILGVRYSDAVAFCEWLSMRERNEWHYRLPKNQEATEYPMVNGIQQHPLGYWILRQTKEVQFTWIGAIPANARNIDQKYVNSYVADLLPPALSRAMNRPVDRDSTLYDALTNELANIEIQNISFEFFRFRKDKDTLARDFDHAIAQAKKINFDRYSTSTNSKNYKENILSALRQAISSTIYFDFDRLLNFDRANLNHAFPVGILFHSSLTTTKYYDFEAALDFIREFAIEVAKNSRKNHRAADIVLDIYIDLLTLQKRMLGDAQAFEGIRLVKERIL